MSKDAMPPFGVPSDMRAVAEQSVEQAKSAFNAFMVAAHGAVSQIEGQAQAAQLGAREVSDKAMGYAEHNVAAAFEFAQKVMRATSVQDLVRLQTEFVQAQMQALSEQAKDLGATAVRSVTPGGKGGDKPQS